MGAVMPKLKGQADGKLVNSTVKELLSNYYERVRFNFVGLFLCTLKLVFQYGILVKIRDKLYLKYLKLRF